MKFLITTRTHWEEPHRSRHQVAIPLSDKNEVFFLAANKIGLPRIKPKKINENLTIYVPYWFVSSKIRYRVPLINELFQIWIFNILKRKLDNAVVINFDHTFHILNKYFNKNIYYCSDEFSGNGKYSNSLVKKYHMFCEKKVSENANICIATADSLFKKLQKYCKNTFEIKLGAPNIEDVKSYIEFNRDGKKKINVGIVGFFDNTSISNSLLLKLSQVENFNLILIGRYNKTVKKLLGDYAILVGEKKEKELYKELINIDVGIAAYSNKANSGTTPNKLWLYLALGKPAVVTNLENIKNWVFDDGLIYKTKNENEFVSNIIKAYHDDSYELMCKRIAFAKENSWEKRVEQLLILINRYIK